MDKTIDMLYRFCSFFFSMHGKTLIDALKSVEFKKGYSLQQNARGRLRGFGFNI